MPELVLPLPAPVLHLHAQDLRWLVGDDFRAEPLLVSRPGSLISDPVARLALGASATATKMAGREDVVRRLPWGLMNHGAWLNTLSEWWPERPELQAAYLEESLGRRAELGVPPRLALQLQTSLSGNAAASAWFSELARWVDPFLDTEIMDFLSVDELAERHLTLRVEIARRVRAAEITNPALISGVELWATVRLLRTAAGRDVSRAWHASKGRMEDVAQSYHTLLKEDSLFFDRAFRAVLRQPEAASLRQLPRFDLQAMALTRELQAGLLAGGGLLADEEMGW